MKRRITDLKRFGTRSPIDLTRQRASEERFGARVLQLQQTTRSRRIAWDLANQKKKQLENDQIFLVDTERPSPWPRVALGFATLTTILIITFVGVFGEGKQTVNRAVSQAFNGVQSLEAAGQEFVQGRFPIAGQKFQTAIENFKTAEADIQTLAGAGAVMETKPENVKSGAKLVSAGKLLASSGAHFSAAAERLRLAFSTWSDRQKLFMSGSPVTSFAGEVSDSVTDIMTGVAELESAEVLLRDVDPTALPTEIANRLTASRAKLNLALKLTQPYLEVLPTVADVLGARVPRRYLILLQNPDEIRPTGGFIGSVALLEVSKGFVKSLEIKDVYEIDGQLTRVIPPPPGYQILTDRWGLRDSNTSPDFPTSASQAAMLFEEAGFGTVDGVIGVTSDLLTRIATKTGGVELTRFGHVVPEDLTLLLSTVIEAKLDGSTAPKKVLTELMEHIKGQVLDLPLGDTLMLARAAISAKEVQLYFLHDEWGRIPAMLQLDGALPTGTTDFVAVTDTSLSGNKSDRYTENSVTHTTAISAEGSVQDTVAIRREHTFQASDGKKIRAMARRVGVTLDDKLIDILGAGRNVDYLKVFVPAGSSLTSVKGVPLDRVETVHTDTATYFVLSLTTPAGESRSVELTYSVPRSVARSYTFTADYQAGTHPTDFKKVVTVAGKEVFSHDEVLAKRTTWEAKW